VIGIALINVQVNRTRISLTLAHLPR